MPDFSASIGNYSQHIQIIHHPSNRPIEPHILIIQQSKLEPVDQFYFINQPSNGQIKTAQESDLAGINPVYNRDNKIGFKVNSAALNKQLKTQKQTINLLRNIILSQ